jgi:hypothetical protein
MAAAGGEAEAQSPALPAGLSASRAWRYDRRSGPLPDAVGPDGLTSRESGGYTPAGYCTPANGDWLPAVRLSGTTETKADVDAAMEFLELCSETDPTAAWEGPSSGAASHYHVTFCVASPLHAIVIPKQSGQCATTTLTRAAPVRAAAAAAADIPVLADDLL